MVLGLDSATKGRAQGEFNNLIDLVSNVVIDQNVKNVWWWKLDAKGAFSVKALSRWIEEHQAMGSAGTYEKSWNNIVPRKVNVFAWRAANGRLPVHVELDKKRYRSRFITVSLL